MLSKITEKLQTWLDTLISNLPNIAIAILVLLASFYISRGVYNYSLKLLKKKIKQRSIARLIARIFSVVVVLLGLFLALTSLNLDDALTGLLTGAGISGIVIGLALQGTLSNTISGIVLAFRENVKIGDWIETSGFTGEVIDIKLNYFVLREPDNKTVIIPNKTVMDNPIKNYSITPKWRISLECGVGYESDLEKVMQLTKNTIQKHFDQKKFDKEVEFFYTEYGSSSINFLCRFWIEGQKAIDRLKHKNLAMIELKKAFDKEGINIPFPIRTLQFDNKLSLNGSYKQEEQEASQNN